MFARTLILAAAASAALSSAALAQGYGFNGPTAMHRGYGGGNGWGNGNDYGSTDRLGPGFGPGGTLHRIDGGRGGTIVGAPTMHFPPGYGRPPRIEPIYRPYQPSYGGTGAQPISGW